jgi:cell division protein FtsN
LQNGSTAKDVAYQQGFQAVAELLEEYERRLTQRSRENSVNEESEETEKVESKTSNGVRSKVCPKNPSYQDIIPSPKHSPLKTKAMNGVHESK